MAKTAIFFDGNRRIAGLENRPKYWLQMELTF